jgi:hypothetical protein
MEQINLMTLHGVRAWGQRLTYLSQHTCLLRHLHTRFGLLLAELGKVSECLCLAYSLKRLSLEKREKSGYSTVGPS